MFSRLIYALSIRLWRLGSLLNRLATLPLVGPPVEALCFRPEESQAVLIPVNEAIQGGESVVLPYTLLPGLIERAAHRVVLNNCLCREGEGCRSYPVDLGCLFLGEGAARIDPALGRSVDVVEAQAHVHRAMARGLSPTILHSSCDAFMLQIPFRRMLAICFCCDCCCTIRQGMRQGPPAYQETVLRLPGLSITVGEGCQQCRRCLDVCPVQAIALQGDGGVIDDERCKGCGRCVATCPTDALSLHVEEDLLARLLSLVSTRTEIES
jgi:UDP-glucose 4-epimerase